MKLYFAAIFVCLISIMVLVWLQISGLTPLILLIEFIALLLTWHLYGLAAQNRKEYEQRVATLRNIEHQVSEKLESTGTHAIQSFDGEQGQNTLDKSLERHIFRALEFQDIMMSNIPVYIFVKDSEFRIVQANERFLNLYPESIRDKVIGYTTVENYPKEQVDAYLKQDRIAFEQGISEVEETIQFPNGELRTLFTKKIRFSDDKGEHYILCISQDISDIVSTRDLLATERDYYESLINRLGVATFVLDQNHKVINWNKACENLTGMPAEQVIGTDQHWSALYKQKRPLISDLMLDNDFSELANLYETSIEDTHVISEGIFVENWCDLKNGQRRYLRIFCNPIRQGGEIKAVIEMMIDMTELKNSQDMLNEQQTLLTESNKQLEQFAYVASHDLQEPLRMVASYTGLLASRYSDKLDDTANEFIEFAVDGAKRMQQMIQDLLAYSRVQTTDETSEDINSNELYQYAMDNLALVIDETGTVVEQQGEFPIVHGITIQLRQLFQNLIGNAIKYHDPEKMNHVLVSVEEQGEFWKFCVEDNGIGIAPEHQQRVFEIFKRLHTKQEYSGTGIGLSICKRIVEKHHGEIWVESAEGEGSKFFFTLPRQAIKREVA